MINYNRLNNIVGWVVFLIAAWVYLSTIEPTTSFWDTGEYIATAYKLQVGHPPGAPFFQMLGRFFSMWTPPDKAAMMINAMSALASAFTILFLFWSITALAKKLILRGGGITQGSIIAIMGSGAVGALAYTFSDTFWFSAVEGEVYALSSFFTAIVFWAILKWEVRAHESDSMKWVVLIAYLIGLSIGVHLLNLLAIPAIVFVYYFKNYRPTRNGFIAASVVSIVLLGLVLRGVIAGMVSLAANIEVFFVNSLGLPFNWGTIIYFIALIGLIIFGLYYTHKKDKPAANTAILSLLMMLIGYSSYFMVVIRSNANPPIDENNPENSINLLSYLNREQYGDAPLLYGPYFNAPLDKRNPYSDGKPVYKKDAAAGRYVITDDRKNSIANYDPTFMTLFPRMYSNNSPSHPVGYKAWGGIKGKPVRVMGARGEPEIITKPTFSENITFFFRYQLNYMYLRYFFWNFVGRQNENQGQTGNVVDGNWMSGIPFIDAMFLGSQDHLPESLTRNKAMNHFYFLPLILGILGIFYQFKRGPEDGWVVFLLFFFTGIATIIYLNQTPYQPRERDYAYAASFYAFAIWIGFGVLSLYDFFIRKVPAVPSAILATGLCLIFVPGIMAKEGWDDHDRSHRYTARDFAKNYLDSCEPNAILFTMGDNDTFPLWYVQEVEGYRTDVRVVNLSLLQTDWYIDQMLRKAYDSDPLPITWTEEQYTQGRKEYAPIVDRGLQGYTNVRELIDFVKSDNEQTKLPLTSGRSIDYLPTNRLRIPVDREAIIASRTVKPELEDLIVPAIEWQLDKGHLTKSELLVLDIITANNWKRPIYFAITTGADAYLGMQDHFQLEGLTYRLIPVKTVNQDNQTGRVDTDILYTNMMKFQWGGMDKREIWMDENNVRLTMNIRGTFNRLADAFMEEENPNKAVEVLDKAMEVMPEYNVPYNIYIIYFADTYYKAGAREKANNLVNRLADLYIDDLTFYASLEDKHARTIPREIEQGVQVIRQLIYMTMTYEQEEIAQELQTRLITLPAARNAQLRDLLARYFQI
jgi:tetratricopeptide (TPR) repeat protein